MDSAPKSLLPHQQRVAEEQDEIYVKIDALGRFIGTITFESLDYPEQSRLRRQLGVMQAYADILDERIRAFLPPRD